MTSVSNSSSLPLKTIVLLGALIALGPLSIDMYLPAFPAITQELGAGGGALQLTLATYFIGLAMGQFFYGPISDRFGRKPPLYFGLTLFVVAALGCALSSSVTALAAWRFLQGIGGCACMVITMAVIRDHASGTAAARAFSRLILVMGIAPIVAPLLGGWLLTAFGWRWIFVVLAAAGLVCLVTIHFRLRESRDPVHVVPLRLMTVLRNYGGLFRDRRFIGYALTGSSAVAGMFAYIAGSPFVLIEIYGVAPQNFGWFFGMNAAGFIIGSQINARLVTRHGTAPVLQQSVRVPAIAGLSLAALAFSGWLPLPMLACGFFAYVGSLGFLNPNSMALALSRYGHRAGTASAFMGTMQFTFATIVGAVMSLWHDGTAWPLACVMGICGLVALTAERLLTASPVPLRTDGA